MLSIAFLLLNTSPVQNWLMRRATQALSDKLQTRVSVDDVSVTFLTCDVKLHGLRVDDRRQQPMLRVEQAVADVDLWSLLHNKVHLSDIELTGVEANLYKASPDTAANYQFVIDAFKNQDDSGGKKMEVTLDDVVASRVNIRYNGNTVLLERLAASLDSDMMPDVVEMDSLRVAWTTTGRQGNTVDHGLDVGRLRYDTRDSVPLVDVERAHYTSDNHLPRKNTGKPHRGFFDVGHLDLTASLQLAVDHMGQDTLRATVKKCVATDAVTGIDIRELQCGLVANRRGIDLSDVVVKQVNTVVRLSHAHLALPDAERGVPFSFSTSTITVTAVLQDIARPFAPVLSRFTLPVQVSVVMDGTAERLSFHNAVVRMAGRKFEVKASGTVTGFTHGERHELHVHFDVPSMRAKEGMVRQIIKQFTTKMFMNKQLQALGDITYSGSFDVYWKREQFRGQLNTQAGTLAFDMEINGLEKLLTGSVKATNLKLSDIISVAGVGNASLGADFKFDISRERAPAGGKLPVGDVTAHVDEVSYRFVKMKNIDVTIHSDGMTAEGDLVAPHKFLDLSCSFSFTDTDELHKLKIKPGIHLHR